MTDASPANRYLLFEQCSDFQTTDKILCALNNGLFNKSEAGGEPFLNTFSNSHLLMRTVEDLKVLASRGDCGVSASPAADVISKSFETLVGPSANTAFFRTPDEASARIDKGAKEHLGFLDATESLGARPWDDFGGQMSYWNWPIETLYQSYHLCVALDFGRQVFEVSRNGFVYVDHTPRILDSLLQVIKTTLQTREQDVSTLKRWIDANLTDVTTRHTALRQVWDPKISVTVLLLNMPGPAQTEFFFASGAEASANKGTEAAGCSSSAERDTVDFFPVEFSPFSILDLQSTPDRPPTCSSIPLLTVPDARLLLEDDTFIDRLRETLLIYEGFYREKAHEWPESNFTSSLEYLIRLAPEASKKCYSVVLVTNTRTMSCSESLFFLEGIVRRKNLILSVVALNSEPAIDAPQFSALTQFLSSVGGFVVNIDYWITLASPRANYDWCHRFEGSRCLAQQLFVQFVCNFPVSFYGITEQRPFEFGDRMPLHHPNLELEDLVFSRCTPQNILRAVAAARFNEGWSVLMDYKDELAASHLSACYHHHFHRGMLTLHYEMDISYPAMYRRMFVSGTKVLVDDFLRVLWNDLGASHISKASDNWLLYLNLLRAQISDWLRAERLMLRLLDFNTAASACSSLLETVTSFSLADGVVLEWLNMSDVRSMGVFLRYEDISSSLFHFLARTPSLPASPPISALVAGRTIINSVMLRMHHMIGKEEDLTFLSKEDARFPRYLVQFFLISDASRTEFVLATGFECRVSFFLCNAATQCEVLSYLIDTITRTDASAPVANTCRTVDVFHNAAEGTDHLSHASFSAAPFSSSTSLSLGRIVVSASLSKVNQGALLVSLTAAASRSSRLSAFYTDCSMSVGALTLFGSQIVPKATSGSLTAPITRFKPITAAPVLRTLFSPHVPSPWIMVRGVRQRWAFCCSELYSNSMHEAFVFLVMRRLHDGFKLLLYYSKTLKAVLQAGIPKSVVVFDIITVLEQHHLVVSRLLIPYSSAAKDRATRDIQEDIAILTALHTFKVFSSLQQSSELHSTVSQEALRRGVALISPRTESLLRYLRPPHARFLELPSAPSLGGRGCRELREGLASLVGAVGDHHARLTTDFLRDDFACLLSCSAAGEAVPKGTRLLVTALHPIRYQTIIFVLILENDTPAGTQSGVVKVALASLSAEVLRYGLMERYRLEQERKECGRLPECIMDKEVLQSLRRMLTDFASIFVVRQLTKVIQGSPMIECSEEMLLKDVHSRLKPLDCYAMEIDASHLLYAFRHQCAAMRSDKGLKSTLTELVAQQIRVFQSDPDIFFPTIADDQPLNGDGPGLEGTFLSLNRNAQSASLLRELPIVMKVEALLTAEAQRDTNEGNGDNAALESKVSKMSGRYRFWISCKHQSINDDDEVFQNINNVGSELLSCNSLRLRLFFKTVPLEMLDLCSKGSFQPSQSTVRSTLHTFIFKCISQKAPENATWGLSKCTSVAPTADPPKETAVDIFQTCETDNYQAADIYFNASLPFSELPEVLAKSLCSIKDNLVQRIALCALRISFDSSCFMQLESFMKSNRMHSDEICDAAASPVATEKDCSDGSSICDCLFYDDRTVCRQILNFPGVISLLTTVVGPALLSSVHFQALVFPVGFTQQATTHRSIDPVKAVVDVFRRCVDEDHMCAIAAGDFSYVFIPNCSFFDHRWIMVHLNLHVNGQYSHQAAILYYDLSSPIAESRVLTHLSKELRTHLSSKITKINQLHLLKQLRDTQYANAELIPVCWGDQFGGASDDRGPASSDEFTRAEASGSTRASSSASFYLHGQNILEIPIYYKLQSQCKKILSCISSNSSRLELINIFNREQCFMVADDDEGDTFHYIRLVFVKDMPHATSSTSLPPQLNASDRCPHLVVQLFAATTSTSIKRPLQKLQDFCYFLAVQELQGHLSYVGRKQISFNDLVFLQNQPLEPLVINLNTLPCVNRPEVEEKIDVQFAIALLFLNLRENKFKHFEVQNEQPHATSTFMEHYNLEEGIKQCSTSVGAAAATPPALSQAMPPLGSPEQCTPSGAKPAQDGCILRFVKITDGLTNALVSCALRHTGTAPSVIVIERYLTKIPSKRYLDGDLEDVILKQLSECVANTVAQLSFHALSGRLSVLSLDDIPHAAEQLVDVAMRASPLDASMLRHEFFFLEEVSPAVYPYLVERLCGALAPYQPRCCENKATGSVSVMQPVRGFPWRWIEAHQRDPLLDHGEKFILCGYTILEDKGDARVVLQPVRAVPYSLEQLPITTARVGEAHAAALKEQGLVLRSLLEWRILVRMSLSRGISIALFNLLDSEFIIRLIRHALEDMLNRSTLLHTVLMQRLGYAVPSAFTGGDLGRYCCGNLINVLPDRPISIDGEIHRRCANSTRFRSQRGVASDSLQVAIEGLYNRGLIVNFTFCLEDAIKVLYDESDFLLLENCEHIMFHYLESGVIVEDSTTTLEPQLPLPMLRLREAKLRPLVCRLATSDNVGVDAFTACSYRRHIVAAHISIEAQSARSSAAEILARCDAVWCSGPQGDVLELAKAVVTLLMQSKQVFGARVPDFLLHREQRRPEADVLSEVLPGSSQQNASYSHPVNVVLWTYMCYLQRLYPSLCIIDLDPSDVATTLDPVLLNRLRCRYGKITFSNGEEICFSPHLYYAVIPLVDLIRCQSLAKRHEPLLSLCNSSDVAVSPAASLGLFIVEVGLQVVHYALDFFIINGSNMSLSATAMVAATFKENLMFTNIIYDATVRYLLQCCLSQATVLPGHQDLSTAVGNLLRYYPFPPSCSTNIAAAYHITDPRLMRLRSLRSNGKRCRDVVHTRGFVHTINQRAFMVLQPEDSTLYQEDYRQHYLYGGLIHWDTARLFVLVATEEKSSLYEGKQHSKDLNELVTCAKDRLLQQLLESTQQERVDAAWDKFLCESTDVLTGITNCDDFELLLCHSQKVLAPSYTPLMQRLFGAIVLSGNIDVLLHARQIAFPDYVLRVLWKSVAPKGPTRGGDLSSDGGYLTKSAPRRISALTLPGADGLFNAKSAPGRMFLTFAPNSAEGNFFLALECWSRPTVDISFIVEAVSFYRRSSDALFHFSSHASLEEDESLLAETLLSLLFNAMWLTVMELPSRHLSWS